MRKKHPTRDATLLLLLQIENRKLLTDEQLLITKTRIDEVLPKKKLAA